LSPDFQDLLSEFNAHGVEYLVVGACEVWVRPDAVNANRVIKALAAFGAPLRDLSLGDLSRPGVVFQIGIAPLRIGVLTSIDGVEFGEAWTERLSVKFADQTVPVLSTRLLIRNKRAVGRAQDLADLEWLERSEKED
jgi:hypothetical protein